MNEPFVIFPCIEVPQDGGIVAIVKLANGASIPNRLSDGIIHRHGWRKGFQATYDEPRQVYGMTGASVVSRNTDIHVHSATNECHHVIDNARLHQRLVDEAHQGGIGFIGKAIASDEER